MKRGLHEHRLSSTSAVQAGTPNLVIARPKLPREPGRNAQIGRRAESVGHSLDVAPAFFLSRYDFANTVRHGRDVRQQLALFQFLILHRDLTYLERDVRTADRLFDIVAKRGTAGNHEREAASVHDDFHFVLRVDRGDFAQPPEDSGLVLRIVCRQVEHDLVRLRRRRRLRTYHHGSQHTTRDNRQSPFHRDLHYFSRGLSAPRSFSASDPNPSAGAASARSAYSRTSSASRASRIALRLTRMRRPDESASRTRTSTSEPTGNALATSASLAMPVSLNGIKAVRPGARNTNTPNFS